LKEKKANKTKRDRWRVYKQMLSRTGRSLYGQAKETKYDVRKSFSWDLQQCKVKQETTRR